MRRDGHESWLSRIQTTLPWFCILCAVMLIVACAVACETTVPAPTGQTCGFDTSPDGTPIVGDTADAEGFVWQSLDGDEFLDCGYTVASTPVTSCVVVSTSYYSTNDNYLWLHDRGNCANAHRIEIHFVEPVSEVSLKFSGASVYYVMEVFNAEGDLLGDPREEAEFDPEGRVFTITFASDETDISWASFGAYLSFPKSVVAIKEVTHRR